MDESDKYFDYIHSLKEEGYITGYSDNTFRPNNPISRTEFLKLLFLIKGVILSQDETDYFLDVNSSSWQKKYVNTAVNLGIITKNNEKFYPNSYITKVEALKITITLFAGEIDNIYSKELSDVFGNEWYVKYVEYTINNSLLPIENEYFYPNKNITRYEIIELLYNISKMNN